MARQKPELYEIRSAELTREFIQALTEGLLLTLRVMGALEEWL